MAPPFLFGGNLMENIQNKNGKPALPADPFLPFSYSYHWQKVYKKERTQNGHDSNMPCYNKSPLHVPDSPSWYFLSAFLLNLKSW